MGRRVLRHLAVDPICLRTQWTRAFIFGKLHPKQPLDVLNELDSKKSQPFAPRKRASLKL